MSAQGTVLVTGAGRGIGRAVALELARHGFDLVLWSRSEAPLLEAQAQARALGVSVSHAVLDVGDAEAVEAAAREVKGALAGVVLNAGHGVWTSLEALAVEEWRHTLRTNLDGAFHVLHACMPILRQRPGALLAAVLSDSALYPFAQRGAYAASKAGLRALLEVARRELRTSGSRVSLIYPSRVDTGFQGAHRDAQPGTRKGALDAGDVGRVIAALYTWPPSVEIRELHLSAMTSPFGPFPEVME
jgi:NADP-dependent 3-hydroxy acid dehydrogenase YdfG